MMFDILQLVLSPIVWLMGIVLDFYISVIGSTGISILLLSFTFTLLTVPLRNKSQKLETRINDRMRVVNGKVKALDKQLKGEQRFLATEKIYKEYNYHPIQSIGQGASFFVMLPILISAIFLLSDNSLLEGKSFLFISDLSQPDQFLFSINVLPLIMTGITILDARLRFKNDAGAQYKFYGIATVLLFLVYSLPSGLVLYWTGANILSFAQARMSAS